MASHLFCGLNPGNERRFSTLLKTFFSQPVLLTATIETEELRGKITQDQYTVVLEDLFIGLTKNSPSSINFIPNLFKAPMERLRSNFASLFGQEGHHAQQALGTCQL